MVENSNSETDARKIEIVCPPSLSEDLWNAIPLELKEKALIESALNLRRGVHPDDTVRHFLSSIGVAV